MTRRTLVDDNMLRILRIFLLSYFETLQRRLRRGRPLPSWNFQFDWIVSFLRRDFHETASWSYPALRADLNTRRYPSTALGRVKQRQFQLGGVDAVDYAREDVDEGRVVLYFHGGSYIFGSAKTSHADLLAELALRTGLRVIGLDYRLAPEHPYPAALEDAQSAYEALLHRYAADKIVLAGDSAGANLALCLQLRLRDAGRPQARAAMLVSAWLDLSASLPSAQIDSETDYGQRSFLVQHAREFAGALPLTDPHLSPLFADLHALAPVHLFFGGAERLRDENEEFGRRARAENVSVHATIATDMPHNPPVLARYHPSAEACLQALADALRAAL